MTAPRRKPFLFLAAVLLLFSYRPHRHPSYAFGPTGPYTHHRILEEAMNRFADRTKRDMNPLCMLTLEQSLYESDSGLARLDFYHCDNSNFYGCSLMLDRLKRNARYSATPAEALRDLALALHIVQDFYAHSNWVEHQKFSLELAPMEAMKDVGPASWLQSGIYPDLNAALLSGDPLVNYYCLQVPESLWGEPFPNAGHACLNKDNHPWGRGGMLVSGQPITYHELAAEYAILHSVELLDEFRTSSPVFATCLVPVSGSFRCSNVISARTGSESARTGCPPGS